VASTWTPCREQVCADGGIVKSKWDYESLEIRQIDFTHFGQPLFHAKGPSKKISERF